MDADRRLHEAIERLQRSFGTARAGCPGEERWARLSARAEGDDMEQLLDHAATCADCAHRLREALLPLEDSSIPEAAGLRSATAAWQHALAARLCVPERRFARPRRAAWLVWGTAAATVLLGLAAGWAVWLRGPSTDELLARAYQQDRPFEFRLMDSGYGAVNTQRSANAAALRAPSLREAEARISRQVREKAGDAQIARQNAETALLEADPPDVASALDTLSRWHERAPNDASLWLPLACAYYRRGEEAAENHADYLRSMDLLAALHAREPRNTVALFDLALVSELAGDKERAISAWEEFLKLDGRSGYAEEARNHLKELRASKASRLQILDAIQANPAAYLALRKSGSASLSNELFLNVAVSEWLPRAARGSAQRAAVDALASDYERQTGDPFLRELGRLPPEEAETLAQGMALAANGRVEETFRVTERSIAVFDRRGESAGSELAAYERVYALHRALRAQECLEEAIKIERQLRSHQSYSWLEAQIQIREAICLARIGKLAAALEVSVKAVDYAARHHLPASELRARTMLDDALLRTGNMRVFWRRTDEDVAAFWRGAFPSPCGHDLLFMLRDAAEELNLGYAAHSFARASTTLLTSTKDPLATALNWHDTAALARAAGLVQDAREDETAAEKLFAGEPDSAAKHAYQAAAVLFAARCALHQSPSPDSGDLVRSLEALDHQLATDVESAERDDLLALAYWKTGRYAGAERLAGDVMRRKLALSAQDGPYDTRAVAETRQTAAAKILAEIRLSRQHDARAAFAVWQAGAAAETAAPVLARRGETYLTWGDLPDGPVLWLLDGRGLSWFRLSASAADIRTRIEGLARDCASPQTSVVEIERQGEAIYRVLLGPVAGRLNGEQPLVIDGEELLSNAPLGVIFPGRFGAPVRSFGLAQYLRGVAASPIDASARLLLFSSPAVSPALRSLYPPLPDTSREQSEVAHGFVRVTVRSGVHATPAALAGDAAGAQVFHFCGHGSADSGTGVLVLAPVSAERPYSGLVTPEVIGAQDWSACRLAVLSACATAPARYARNGQADSIVRALLGAGAARVVASLWNVDSSATCSLMARFYRLLLLRHTPAEALWLAEAELRRDRSTSHPYYWAAFQLYGAP